MTQYPIPNSQYFTIKHNQHTDRKNTTTLFFLKNSRVLLYLFFSQKQSCFIVSFLGSKMSVKRDFRSLQNFWVLGIGTLGIALIASSPPPLPQESASPQAPPSKNNAKPPPLRNTKESSNIEEKKKNQREKTCTIRNQLLRVKLA